MNIPASKSVLIRALLLKSYSDFGQLEGESDCEDVQAMRLALSQLFAGEPVYCGEAGTVFRLIALRASRLVGEFRISGSARLLSRPHDPLIEIMNALGVQADIKGRELVVNSKGWQKPESRIEVDHSFSSQFASSLLLNAWDIPFLLKFCLRGSLVSLGYWRLSQALAIMAGMKFVDENNHIDVHPRQSLKKQNLRVKMDMSSAFAVAALGVVGNGVNIANFPDESLQPDFVFVDILQRMGAKLAIESGSLKVSSCAQLRPISWNLKSCPDLFPVLSVLCAFAEGRSELFGAAHLSFKESQRIEKTAELLRLMGRKVEIKKDGLAVVGQKPVNSVCEDVFDPDKDHRLAMAAAVARMAGYEICISDPSVVNKSFPGFWQVWEQLQ